LKNWRIRIRQTGYDIGRKGMQDEEIISFLHQLRHPTFFIGTLVSMNASYVTEDIAWFV